MMERGDDDTQVEKWVYETVATIARDLGPTSREEFVRLLRHMLFEAIGNRRVDRRAVRRWLKDSGHNVI